MTNKPKSETPKKNQKRTPTHLINKLSPGSISNTKSAKKLEEFHQHIYLTEEHTPEYRRIMMFIKIEIAMRKKKMKKTELAKKLGISSEALSTNLSNRTSFRLDRLLKIEDILNVKLIDFG